MRAPERGPVVYERRRPERSALYEVVRDNLDTLYGGVDDDALGAKIAKHARKELDAFLDCGLLCRGFARLRCEGCTETRLVSFSCKGRGFCPSCLGRRMCATAADLVEHVLPQVELRQWVLTFPFAWRGRLAHDGALLSTLSRVFVECVEAHYRARAKARGAEGAKTGAVTVVQRTSSDLRLNPHLHVVFLDGTYHERGAELVWQPLGHLRTSEVGALLERAVRRMAALLRRRGLLASGDGDGDGNGEGHDAADDEVDDRLEHSAVAGQSPPAGPQWRRGLRPLTRGELAFDKPLCASLDGFTLHAATTVSATDAEGREALLRYVLRPAVAQERITLQPNGLVRIALKRPFADGTTAIDLDPLSLLCRLAASVPPPRHHLVKYAGVLAPASKWRSRIGPRPVPTPAPESPAEACGKAPVVSCRKSRYRPWAELLARTFSVDVLQCPTCKGRMKLLAVITDQTSITRYLAALGEPTDAPARSPNRGPPYWKSTVLRRRALDDVA